MTVVFTGLAVSVDGYITGPDPSTGQALGDRGGRLFEWYDSGDTQSRFYPSFRLSAASAAVFDAHAARNGAIVAGRTTYDHVSGWGGTGPQPGVPLFVLTHQIPDEVPDSNPPYTFVTSGIESAIAQARVVTEAAGKDVALMGGRTIQSALRAGLLDEFTLHQVPVLLGGGTPFFGSLANSVELELTSVIDTDDVTHLTYRVLR